MNLTSQRFALLATAVAYALISGCGGGGGSTGTSAPPPASGDIVTQVPVPSYAAASSELLAFNRLNADRDRCGFGKLAQNDKLDRSAAAHRAYMVVNQVLTHNETQGLPGFTGTTALPRAIAQGYPAGSIQENLAAAGSWGAPEAFTDGASSIMLLAGGVYHGALVTDGYRDVGISWGGGAFAVETGLSSGVAAQSAPGVRTYPCDGSADVVSSISQEEPNPFPNEATSWGPTIQVVGEQVRLSSAAISGPTGSVAIKAIYGDGQQQDPNGRCTGSRSCVIPVTLQRGTSYQVQLSGTQAGQPFGKAFTFTTQP